LSPAIQEDEFLAAQEQARPPTVEPMPDHPEESPSAETDRESATKSRAGYERSSVELFGEPPSDSVLLSQGRDEQQDHSPPEGQPPANAAEADPVAARPHADIEEGAQLADEQTDPRGGFSGQESAIEQDEPLPAATDSRPDTSSSPESMATPTTRGTPASQA